MPSSISRSAALIKLPITGTERNILTKIDDHGYFASLNRNDGESVTNFKTRLASSYTRPGNSNTQGLTDAIARDLGLGHETLLSVTSSASLKLDVYPEYIRVSGTGTYGPQKIDIVDIDPDGYWILPNIGKVASGLNNVSGISATPTTNLITMPAILLEEQSSYVTEFQEQVPPTTSFRLGRYKYGKEITGTVISGTVYFTDDITYATEVSGVPQAAGEWSVDQTTNSIRSYELPRGPVNVIYTHSILESGMTMNLVGNGVKVMNLMLADTQNMLFQNSGIGASAQSIINELRIIDRNFWGK